MRKSSLVALAAVPMLIIPAAPALAAPTIPDSSSVFPQVEENPQITVTDEAGNAITGPVHRGDVLLVHGTGFSPEANQGGFPLPVPPGTPNGVWVMYSAFPDQWRPSEGAGSETRAHPHDRMAWVMPEGTLETIPQWPVDMRRSIARQTQQMNDDGTFTARIVVDPPKETAGDNWGVYVYAAGGSVNASEEFYVPIPYSAEPGPNTPSAPTNDLQVEAGWLADVTELVKGGINPKEGATYTEDGKVTFSRDADQGDGVRRYRGTVTATAKFNMVEVAVKDPWLKPLGNGLWAVSAEVSRAYNVGADEMVRLPLGVIRAGDDPVQIP